MKAIKKPVIITFSILLLAQVISTGQEQSYVENETGVTDLLLFDFWVGEWDLTWQDNDSTVGKGKNIIKKILNDQVVYENFSGLTGQYKGFEGKSYSMYDRLSGQWKQTWVDNQGSYLDFVGRTEGKNRIFERSFMGPNGNEVRQRMVFHDITEDRFIWDWQYSTDEGITWLTNWQIFYKRTD
jgi:hypothetical protein